MGRLSGIRRPRVERADCNGTSSRVGAPFRSAGVVALAAGLLAVSACSSSAGGDPGLAINVGKGIFQTGKPIPLELTVRHDGKGPLVLTFSTAQRYDFQVEKEGGEVLWRWSEGKMFAQVLGQVVLDPNRPEIRYRAVFQSHLPPGRYRARGILTTRPRPPSAVADITIQ
ncbi:MAG: BsuPI-related putative proteinase inhibitor [Nitrospinota bacterium]